MNDLLSWIIGIGTLVLGGGLITKVVMHFIEKRDKRQESQRTQLYSIQDNLAEYKKTLVDAFLAWQTLFSEFLVLVDSYISFLQKEKEQLEELNYAYKEYIKSHKDCFCEFAATCSKRMTLPPSKEEEKLRIESVHLEREIEERNQDYINKFSKLFGNIAEIITPFGDFLASLNTVYKLDKKKFDSIYSHLKLIDDANLKLQVKLRTSHVNAEDYIPDFMQLEHLLKTMVAYIEETQKWIHEQTD